jgi:putative membrane protein
MRVIAAVATVALLGVARLAAHGGESHAHGDAQALSPWDLATVAMLIAVGALYMRGVRRLRARGATHPRLEQAAFAAGWTALMAAVLPPMDALAIEWFSAHMAQHEVMMLVGAPLIIAGRPLPVWLWGLPERWRPRTAHLFHAASVAGTWRIVTAPLVAWTLHGLAVWGWHLPAAYELAVRNEGVHAIQHATFVGTSALFWWGLLYGRYGRAGYGAAVLYVFTTAVHTGILGAMLTFAGTPLYGIYAGAAAARGGDALGDQQAAGLLMWIPAGIVLTMMGLGLFGAWLGEAGRRAGVPRYDDRAP